MPDTVVFEDYGIKVSAYTDLYAYDPENNAVLLVSLAGNEQAVKAVSSAIVACKTVTINEGQSMHLLTGRPDSRYRIMSTKLAGGFLHQIVADSRFFMNSDAESRLVTIPANAYPHEAIYGQVLVPLASPVIPVWAQWLCERFQQMDRLKEMAGTFKAVKIGIDDLIVDEIVSEGIQNGIIGFNEQGGFYVGVH
jgi:hypothetical protein